MFYGEYHHTLDKKGRLIIPAKFRGALEENYVEKFFITQGLDGCLFLFHADIWADFENRLKSLSFTKQQSRFFNRIYFSGAQEVDIDAQGRLSLPTYLKEFAHIKREIVIVGVADRIEIWSRDEWNKFYSNNRQRFEEVAENLFE